MKAIGLSIFLIFYLTGCSGSSRSGSGALSHAVCKVEHSVSKLKESLKDPTSYDINVPKEWFKKWRRIITITAKIIFISTKIALTASGVGSLSNMIPDTLSLEAINQALPLLDIVSQDIIGKTIGEVVSEKSQDMLNDFNTALEEDSEMTNLVENANNAFNELESFLNGREPLPKFSGLIRDFHPNNIPNAGKATWVCKYHAQIIQKYKEKHEPPKIIRETTV